MATPPKKPASKTPRKPARPKNLPHGRWLDDFPDLSAAELRLVECCRTGDVWAPEGWDRQIPIRPTEESKVNRIRADLIRFLTLGGDALHPAHEQGVMISGAWITGTLDLHQCCATVRLSLKHCHFTAVPCLLKTALTELVLSGSLLPGLSADGLTVTGDVFLSDGFISESEVVLIGAEICGDLDCVGGAFFGNSAGVALAADRMRVNGSFFLCQPRNDIESKHVTIVRGAIFLSAARIGTLIDDAACWQSGQHILDGLHYDRIVGPLDAPKRIAWLKSQRADQNAAEDWSPQPWEHLTKVLREMGHSGTAADIAMEKQRMMRAAGQIGTRTSRTDFEWRWLNRVDALWTKLSNFIARGFHDIYGTLAGYGYRPTRIAAWMLTVWLACSLLYWTAADHFAVFGPANPAITSPTLYPEADRLCGHGNETGKQRWTECPGVPDEYSTFQPFIYSLDVILPLIDLHQEVDWAPIAEGPTGSDLLMGVIVRWVMWFEILFGWLASLMFVAIVSRLVDKD